LGLCTLTYLRLSYL